MQIRGRQLSWKRLLLYGAGGLFAIFVLAQAIPYGRDHTNPPVIQEPRWDSAKTREYAVGACFDCHSNQTKWPWYTNVAPASWLTERDVNSGRSTLNFSEWKAPQDTSISDIIEAVQGGSMPPFYYAWMPNHPKARLSKSDKAAFVHGLQSTFKTSPPAGGGGG